MDPMGNGLAVYVYRIPVVVGRCTLKHKSLGHQIFPPCGVKPDKPRLSYFFHIGYFIIMQSAGTNKWSLPSGKLT